MVLYSTYCNHLIRMSGGVGNVVRRVSESESVSRVSSESEVSEVSEYIIFSYTSPIIIIIYIIICSQCAQN